MTDPKPVCTDKTKAVIAALRADPVIAKAIQQCEEQHQQRIDDQVKLTEIPAPPFHEEVRADALVEMFKQYGVENAHKDTIGNVIGRVKGSGNGPVLVIGAHIDTVFKEGTDCTVRKEGNVYYAPGISDDAGGLAGMLQVMRCVTQNNIKPVGDIVFVGTLGEEGNGDLRGCKALFKEKNDYDGMIAIDSANVHRILRGAVGCKRFRIIFESMGGHSLHKFGIVGSTIHGLARAITMVDNLEAPQDPKCTFNFGVIKGGTSVNAIAARAEAELDIRSFNQPSLEAFVEKILATIKQACEDENKRWNLEGENAVRLIIEQIGDRPAGMNADDASVIQAAYGALLSLDISLDKYTLAATDQNVPLYYGLPATTLGAGGTEANNHALSESWDSTDAFQGPQVAFLTAMTLVGVQGVTEPILEKAKHE
ncbi:M20/M25/M40 family metallo-hydrolase [uncultured Parasutterella sp.]|uniref:M20/M25/M40 family metallo-hydrolase n=1 Tax=uncultured Parasutterella sp. TaxID=1263098 RepID=UPI0034A2947F